MDKKSFSWNVYWNWLQDEKDRDVGDAKTTLHRGDILLSSAILDDPGHENRMSFDDLEQVYKNISRRKILNKVKVRGLRVIHKWRHTILDTPHNGLKIKLYALIAVLGLAALN